MKIPVVIRLTFELLGFCVVAIVVGLISLLHWINPSAWKCYGESPLGQPT